MIQGSYRNVDLDGSTKVAHQEPDAEPQALMDTGEDSQIPSPSPASLPTKATRGSSGELQVVRYEYI